jgi:hypothetical protein
VWTLVTAYSIEPPFLAPPLQGSFRNTGPGNGCLANATRDDSGGREPDKHAGTGDQGRPPETLDDEVHVDYQEDSDEPVPLREIWPSSTVSRGPFVNTGAGGESRFSAPLSSRAAERF